MSRKQPENSEHGRLLPPEVTKQSGLPERTMKIGAAETKMIVQTRQYKLITPLFGGGVEPGVNDLGNLIRGTEIRGQLRFWWRAIRGGQFGGDLAAMKKREDEIWGSASVTKKQNERDKSEDQASSKQQKWTGPVQTLVSNIWQDENAQKTITLPSYAAFPLTDQEGGMQAQKITSNHQGISCGIHFELSLTYPIFPDEQKNQPGYIDMKLEVNAALWAWETFGGIGARTRRGFGMLQREGKEQSDLPLADRHEAEKWLKDKINCWCTEEAFPDNVPHLGSEMHICIASRANMPLGAWNNALDKLRKFRQIPEGRDKRSRWPEAETIRQMTGYRFKKHTSLNHPQKFPRAAFGLPIVFHFKDEDKKKPPSQRFDPPEMTLQGAIEGQERWSSPLILRPLICQNGQALSFACILQGTVLPEQMRLKAKDDIIQSHDIARPQTRLEAGETAGIPILHGQTDVLLAFLKYFGL